MQYEAQAAILLEQAALRHIQAHDWPPPMLQGWLIQPGMQLSFLPLLEMLAQAPAVDHAAARFHATLVAGLADWVMHAVAKTGIRTVAWGGGCFLNSLLSSGLALQLQQRGVTVLSPVRTSAGDGSIALGQAWVAMQSSE
jgi:hydrogenase maturation protein HypF